MVRAHGAVTNCDREAACTQAGMPGPRDARVGPLPWVPSQTRLSSGVDMRVEIRGNSELCADRWTQKAASPSVEEGPAQVTYRPREFLLGGEWG